MYRFHDVMCLLLLLCAARTRCKPFSVYWNIPTCTCKTLYNMSFYDTVKTFGITINDGDLYEGRQMNILYTPGLVPRIYNSSQQGYEQDVDYSEMFFVNGGVPQSADVLEHLNEFERVVKRKIPDTHNTGLIVVDIEEWGATWSQNFNSMEVYRVVSRQMLQEKFPLATPQEIERLASLQYDRAALSFLVKTLMYGKALRPKAKWGYYQYPQCFNRPGVETCSEFRKMDNDQMIQMWKRSDVVFPSLYLTQDGSVDDRVKQIRGKTQEARRVADTANDKLLIIPYISTKYHNGHKLLDEDLENLIKIPKEEGADGVVIWGAYNDYKTKEQCEDFNAYLAHVLGPVAKKYISLV